MSSEALLLASRPGSPSGEEVGCTCPSPSLGASDCWGHTHCPVQASCSVHRPQVSPSHHQPVPGRCSRPLPSLRGASPRSVHRLGRLPGPPPMLCQAGPGLQPSDTARCPPIRQLGKLGGFQAHRPSPHPAPPTVRSWAGSEQGGMQVAAYRPEPACLCAFLLPVQGQVCLRGAHSSPRLLLVHPVSFLPGRTTVVRVCSHNLSGCCPALESWWSL